MPKCNKCKTIYNAPQRDMLIKNKQYWCPLCSTYYKIFNPFPASYFQPELTIEYVIQQQIKMWERGTLDGYFRNKMKSAR
jgi:hypothetical protein